MTHPLEASWPLLVSTQPGRDWPWLHARAGRSSAEFAILLPVKRGQGERHVVVDRHGKPDPGNFSARLRIELPPDNADGVRYFDHELVRCHALDPDRCDAVAVLFIGPARFRAPAPAGAPPEDDEARLRAALAKATCDIPSGAIARWRT